MPLGGRGFSPSILAGLALVVTMLVGAVAARPARAHLGHEVVRAERYLKLDVSDHAGRLVVSLTLGAGEGARLLASADTDADGAVSEAERDAYLAAWGEGLRSELPVSVDGVVLELTWGEPFLDPIGAVRPTPVTVEMVARFELGGGEETVRIEDRMVRREAYDRTDVAFRVRGEAQLVRSGVGEAPSEPMEDVAYGREIAPDAPVVLTAVVETPPRRGWLPWLGLGAAAFALLALGAYFARRSRP